MLDTSYLYSKKYIAIYITREGDLFMPCAALAHTSQVYVACVQMKQLGVLRTKEAIKATTVCTNTNIVQNRWGHVSRQ
jgi:hypothetical protein